MIRYPEFAEVRGEVVLPISRFRELTNTQQHPPSEGDDAGNNNRFQFSNARNAASGILLRRSGTSDRTTGEIGDTERLRSSLRFYAYSLAVGDGSELPYCNDGRELRDLLEGTMGFSVPCPVLHTTVAFHSPPTTDNGEIGDNGDDTSDTLVTNGSECADLFNYHNLIASTRDDTTTTTTTNDSPLPTPKFHLDYEVDGAVYKLTSLPFRATLGSSARAPRWAITHKFSPRLAVTRLLDIDVQVGRTGSLTPVAVLDPVELGGGLRCPERVCLILHGRGRTIYRCILPHCTAPHRIELIKTRYNSYVV